MKRVLAIIGGGGALLFLAIIFIDAFDIAAQGARSGDLGILRDFLPVALLFLLAALLILTVFGKR